MKHLLYTLAIGTLTILMYGCADIQKLVDEGNYDAAIDKAARKLSGKKNKKTKYVKGLEQAFAKVSARDLDQVAYLKTKGDARS